MRLSPTSPTSPTRPAHRPPPASMRPLLLLSCLLLPALTLSAQGDFDLDKTTSGTLGSTLSLQVHNAAANRLVLVAMSYTQGPSAIAPFDPADNRSFDVGLELASNWYVLGTDGAGALTIPTTLPLAVAFAGQALHWQCATFPGTTTVVDEISNAVVTQLGIRFELHEKNGRAYPTLRELLKTESPSGKTVGFLAKEDSFRFLQEMQRAGKIVPIVGDFAGDHALAQLASYLKGESRKVGVFYVSNVEQYLLEPKIWKKWVRNVKELPKTEQALFLRGYLDQGKKHPKQMKGQRTATVLSKISDFETRFGDKPTATFYALSTEDLVAPR